MTKICVLHLSDMHIGNSEDSFTEGLRKCLLEDLIQKKNEQKLNVDIVAITGDSVDKGGSKEAFQKAENFYAQIAHELNIEKERFAIVPGNHDFARKDIVNLLLSNTEIENFYDENKFQEYWETLELRQKPFKNFAEKIVSNNDYALTRYGGAVKNIKINNTIVRLILINSSWSCVGERDYGRLLIGKPQLEELTTINNNLPQADLTIGLIHHPFDWLEENERALCIEYLTHKHKLKVDSILHGHIHSGKLVRISSPDKDLLSLISGVGYPEKGKFGLEKNKIKSCRYAIYTFDTETGFVNVQLRISSETGTFSSDTLMYDLGKENGIFNIPYKTNILNSQTSATLENKAMKNHSQTIEIDAVPKIRDWVGREDEILIPLKRNLSVISITGVGGQGKTGLASEYLRKYSRGENSLYDHGVWIDCRELPDSLHYKLIETLEKLSGGLETVFLYKDERLEDTVKRFLKHLNKQKVLVVFDNIDAYVKADTEGPVEELKPLFDALCNNEHSSLVIFTCRPPLIHSSSNFHHIQLMGLNSSVAIDFFRNRDIKLIGDNNEKFAEEVFRLTKGHPWWLGLIAGQVNTGQETLKKCAGRLKRGEETIGESINEYFKDIWQQLNKERQNLLRHLVVSHRSLTDKEINLVVSSDYGPVKLNRELKRLKRLGLIEAHESKINNEETLTYQVHPLIREFVNQSYTTSAQERYVERILCVFLPRSVFNYLFYNKQRPSDEVFMEPSNIIDSIETCLNSRNPEKALGLISSYYSLLYDRGYHHQFYSLASRILDSVNWESTNILNRSTTINFLHTFISHLSSFGEKSKCNFYLRKYNSLIETGTLSHLNYLAIACQIAWTEGKNEESIRLADDHFSLASKLEITESHLIAQHRALALRDSGRVSDALKIFQELEGSNFSEDATFLGNCARCYLKLGDYSSAEENIRKSLIILASRNSYNYIKNIGYAYLWISELMFEQQLYKESKAFLYLAESIWNEYAPGLIYKVRELEVKLKQNEYWNQLVVNEVQAKKIENDFINK